MYFTTKTFYFLLNKEKVAFYANRNGVQMRQQTIFKKKDGCQIASTKLVAS
jgi:hypothetical protein